MRNAAASPRNRYVLALRHVNPVCAVLGLSLYMRFAAETPKATEAITARWTKVDLNRTILGGIHEGRVRSKIRSLGIQMLMRTVWYLSRVLPVEDELDRGE
jgi:hypothetical protein